MICVVFSVSKAVQLDVVELLKQVLQWTPLYKPGLNKALLQAAKVGSVGCVKVRIYSHSACGNNNNNNNDINVNEIVFFLLLLNM